jgi:hypothetical protein
LFKTREQGVQGNRFALRPAALGGRTSTARALFGLEDTPEASNNILTFSKVEKIEAAPGWLGACRTLSERWDTAHAPAQSVTRPVLSVDVQP